MLCKDLGGPNCDIQFSGTTFNEIATQSQEHGKQMMKEQEPEHLNAMSEMNELMKDPAKLGKWMESKEQAFQKLQLE